MTLVRVGVCDGDPLVQRGLASQIHDDPELCVSGRYGRGADALAAGLSGAFDILLVDLRLPDMTAGELIAGLSAGGANCRVIYVTAFPPAPVNVRVGDGIIAGVLAKSIEPQPLAAAIKAAALGLSVASAGFPGNVTINAHPTLASNSREADVLHRLCMGWSNGAIAADLHLSVSTVKSVVAGLLLRSGARNRAELVHMESSGAPQAATTPLRLIPDIAGTLAP